MNKIIKEDMDFIIKSDLPWEQFKNRTFLITGVNGMLPSYLIRVLLYLNDQNPDYNLHVVGLARNREKVSKKFNDYLNREDFEVVYQDVCDDIKIEKTLDYIIHAASQASPKYFGIDPVGTLKANVIGTYNLLELARKNPLLCFLFFSSGEVYGTPNEEDLPINETFHGNVNQLDVRACYAESKRMGENMCISWYHQYNVPCKIVRPFHTYGPGLDLNDKRVFADFVNNIVNGQDIVLKSDGSATRAFCYIADAILGFFTVLLKGNVGEAYNVASSDEISILELAKTLVNLFPSNKLKLIQKIEEIDNDKYFKSKISRSFPDIGKMRALNWEPKISIEEGFRKTINSFLTS